MTAVAPASTSQTELHLPPGFRFHPTDEELVEHYLCRKCAGQPIVVPIVAEIDLYKFDPWNLPGMALYGEKEWYFFSPRDRKYPNGSRPNRAAGTGYWKATGADKPIGRPKPVGIKKALVFYAGKAPKGEKTNWIMHEYRLADVDRSARKKNSLRLDDWVLCRIYNKKGTIERRTTPSNPQPISSMSNITEEKKPCIEVNATCQFPRQGQPVSDYLCFDEAADSVLKLQQADSSCSEHVVSPEFTSEVQSETTNHWEENYKRKTATAAANSAGFDFPYNYVDVAGDCGAFAPQLAGAGTMSPLQDMFLYLPKLF